MGNDNNNNNSNNKSNNRSLRKRDLGLCFIKCPEAHKIFGYDVWAYPADVEGFKIGDALSFQIKMDHWWNYPVAIHIKSVPCVASGVAPVKVDLKEAELKEAEAREETRLGPGVAVRLFGLTGATELN